MKSRLFFLTLSLVAVLLIVSCSPTAATQETIILPVTASSVSSATATEAVIPNSNEATQVPVVQAVATSRGPDLHATDPTTVSLASGQLQLVEFFRFT